MPNHPGSQEPIKGNLIMTLDPTQRSTGWVQDMTCTRTALSTGWEYFYQIIPRHGQRRGRSLGVLQHLQRSFRAPKKYLTNFLFFFCQQKYYSLIRYVTLFRRHCPYQSIYLQANTAINKHSTVNNVFSSVLSAITLITVPERIT